MEKKKNEDFKNLFSKINNSFINKIETSKNKMNDFIEKELFEDCISTYKRAYKLVENNQLLDGIVLTRNAFEIMVILFAMRIDTKVKKEYCREDSYERYIERRRKSKKAKDYLSQSYLRDTILKKYTNIDEDYNKIYSILSKFAHPTIHRNILRFFEREKADVAFWYLNIIMILPMLFLEILFEESIISEETFQDSLIFKYIIERLTLIYIINNVDKSKLMAANRYAFLEVNKDYYNNTEYKVKNEIINIEKDLKDNQDKVNEAIQKVLSKVEYYDIGRMLIELEINKMIGNNK